MNKQKKVLLIEDDTVDQIIFKRFVKYEGYQYDLSIADSVASAKEILSSNSFDVIIVDYSLGDGTAFDLIDLINETPLIFTTGVGDEETAVRAMKVGVYDYIIKDLDRNYIKLLPSIIENAIKNKKDKAQLKMLSQAIMNINDNIYITDINYKIQFVNSAFCSSYGYSEDEIIGKCSSIIWNDEDIFQKATNKLLESGCGEFYHRKKDGTVFPVSISRSIVNDKNGRDSAIINIVGDISERKQAEENILMERDKAQRYLDIAGVILLIVDNNQNISLINKKGCEILGYDKTELIGSNWFDNFIPMPERAKFKAAYDKWMNEESAVVDYIEITIIVKNGNEKIIAWHNTLLRDKNGKVIGTLSSGEDITMRMEIDKVKSEFVNTVSHEIRTPLTVILGICQLLLSKDDLDSDKMKKYFNTMYVESRRLTDLVNDFLDIQRMESGRQVFEMKKMRLIDAVDEVIELYESNETHDIILDLDRSEYSPIYGDFGKIRQLIMNLVSNAIKYSPDAKEIYIKITESENLINVSVTDYGLGIPADCIPNLFKKFYRVDISDHRKIVGTGLGLAICKEIVSAHNGEIGVKSQLGKGSEFYFSIPKMNQDV